MKKAELFYSDLLREECVNLWDYVTSFKMLMRALPTPIQNAIKKMQKDGSIKVEWTLVYLNKDKGDVPTAE